MLVSLYDEFDQSIGSVPGALGGFPAHDPPVQTSSLAQSGKLAAWRYEITGADVWAAYSHTMKAAERQGGVEATRQRIRDLVASETFGERFVTKILGRELGLTRK